MKWPIINTLLLIASPLVMLFYGIYIFYRLKKGEAVIEMRYREHAAEKHDPS